MFATAYQIFLHRTFNLFLIVCIQKNCEHGHWCDNCLSQWHVSNCYILWILSLFDRCDRMLLTHQRSIWMALHDSIPFNLHYSVDSIHFTCCSLFADRNIVSINIGMTPVYQNKMYLAATSFESFHCLTDVTECFQHINLHLPARYFL